MWTGCRIFFYIAILTYSALSLAEGESVCSGPAEILNVTDRGGNADSPCVVPFKKLFLEGGYEYQAFNAQGWLQDYPQGNIRLGLPSRNEVFFSLPNYNRLNVIPASGYDSGTVGWKHELHSDSSSVTTLEATITPPGGSFYFGSKGFGVSVTGLMGNMINEQWGWLGMLEVGSFTAPRAEGGERFTNFTPDMVISYSPIEKIAFYAEAFGYTKLGPEQGGVVIIDAGILYMLTPHVAFDFSVFHQLTHNVANYRDSIVAGITLDL